MDCVQLEGYFYARITVGVVSIKIDQCIWKVRFVKLLGEIRMLNWRWKYRGI
jgi:hypothetical protein